MNEKEVYRYGDKLIIEAIIEVIKDNIDYVNSKIKEKYDWLSTKI